MTSLHGHKPGRCILCGMCFMVGRLRTALEPITAAWSWRDTKRNECAYQRCMSPEWAGGCGKKSGCMLAFRLDTLLRKGCVTNSAGIQGNSVPKADIRKQQNPILNEERPSNDRMSEYIQVVYGASQTSNFLHVGDWLFWNEHNVEEIIRRSLENEGFTFREKTNLGTQGAFEHVSGPCCEFIRFPYDVKVYSGHRISVEEMETSRAVQYIMLQDPLPCSDKNGRPVEQDIGVNQEENRLRDHDNGNWCLSDSSPYDSERSEPLAHYVMRRVRQSLPANHPDLLVPFVLESATFHPTCFEVLKRAALRRHGKFNIEDLGKLVQVCKLFAHRFRAHYRPDLEWHRSDNEWLAANPCTIPGLHRIVDNLRGTAFKYRSSDNEDDATGETLKSTMTGFTNLPIEICLEIFDQIHVADVAAVSIAFPELRNITNPHLFYRLDVDYPYLWEFWCEQPYSEYITKQMVEINGQVNRIFSGTWNVNGNTDSKSVKRVIETIRKMVCEYNGYTPESVSSVVINANCDIDFAEFLVEVNNAYSRGELKGLKKRYQVWGRCEQILDRIDLLEKYTSGNWDVRTRQATGNLTQADLQIFAAALFNGTDRPTRDTWQN